MRQVFVVFALSRAVLLVALLVLPGADTWIVPEGPTVAWKNAGTTDRHLYDPVRALDAWVRNDGTYYLQIAALGYLPGEATGFQKEGFLPGYPWLVRAVATTLGSDVSSKEASARPYLIAGILVSNACALLALFFLVRLARRVVGEESAIRAGYVFALNPFSFLVSCHLSEPLFLVAALGAVLAADAGRFSLSGLSGAVAGMTRIFAPVLVFPLALRALLQKGTLGKKLERLSLLLLLPAGLAFALVMMGRATGDPWIYFKVQQFYGHEDFPTLSGLTELFRVGSFSLFEPLRDGLQAALVLLVAFLLSRELLRWRTERTGGSDLLYALVLSALPILAGNVISFPRYTIIIYPLYWALGRLLPGGKAGILLGLASLLLQAFLLLTFEAHLPIVI